MAICRPGMPSSKPRGDFADARGALGDDDELDHHDDDEDDHADDHLVAGDELAEAFDHSPRSRHTLAFGVSENEPSRGHIEHQPASVVASKSEGKMLNSSGVRT